MRAPGACVFVLMVSVSAACGGQASGSSADANIAASPMPEQADGKQYQAVCIEAAAHAGNEYILSRWLDSRDKALALAEYHGNFKEKGHRWRIDVRDAPAPATPTP